jgi:rod shape-determining protein MreC
MYLAANAQVRQGARIMTSGQGGVFPPGIPVGVVAFIDANGVRAESFVTNSDLEYVRIIDYGLTGALDDDRRDGIAKEF